MRSQNICKFISESEHSELKTVNFIFEQNPDAQQTTVTLSNHAVYLIAQGTGIVTFDNTPVPVRKGDLIFGFSGEAFSGKGQELKYFYVGFAGQRAQDLFRRFGITAATRRFSGHEGMLPFWEESIARATDENVDIVSECVLTYAFSRLTGVREPGEDLAYQMTKYTEENFSDPTLTLASLAEEWGYNSKYLSDCFKKKIGVGFSHYLRTVRIKHAVFLMDHGVEAVKNVAILCGFQDPLYFSKVFRESLGLSPTEYLKQKQNTSGESK